MLDESIINLQITLILLFGTIVFILVAVKRKDLIIYLPAYLFSPSGYLFIYLQSFEYSFRLLGNLLFLIGSLTLLFTVYYEYFKVIRKTDKNPTSNLKLKNMMITITPLTLIIVGIQTVFSIPAVR